MPSPSPTPIICFCIKKQTCSCFIFKINKTKNIKFPHQITFICVHFIHTDDLPKPASTASPAAQPFARPRRHASNDLLMRARSSFRGTGQLSEQSPFKRQLSLRLNELPSTIARQQQVLHTHQERKSYFFFFVHVHIHPVRTSKAKKKKKKKKNVWLVLQRKN